MNYYKEYIFDINRLNPKDQKAVAIIKDMLKLCAQIYEKQANVELVGSNFYPHDATKEEVLKAAESDKEIVSPYTMVKRDEAGKLYAVAYSIEFKDELTQISELALKAAAEVDDILLKGYLTNLAEACKNNSWEELENYWLGIAGNPLDLQLSAIEPYMDGLLNIKHSFQATLRYKSDLPGFNPDNYIETIKVIKLTATENQDEITKDAIVRVDDLIAAAGHQVMVPARGSNYPNNLEKVFKYGTKIIIYTNNIIEREEKNLMPILRKIVKPEIVNRYTADEYFASFVRNVLTHEVAESYIKYRDTVQRLKDMYLPVRELHSSLMGLKIAAYHVLHGALSSNGYESMLLTLCVGRTFSDYYRNQDPKKYNKGLEHYVRGYTVTFNYLLQNGAVVIGSDGLIDIDYAKMFVCIDELGRITNQLKKSGTEFEAKEFFRKYEDYDFYNKFVNLLS